MLTPCVLLLAPTRAVGADWTQYGANVNHTDYSNTSADPNAAKFLWQAPTGYSEPVIADGAIYSLNRSLQSAGTFTLSSFNPVTGQVNWSQTGSYLSPSAVAYADGLLVHVASTGSTENLIVRDASTGSVKYTVPFALPDASRAGSTPLLAKDDAGNLIAYFAGDATMHAVQLGATSGTVLWNHAAPDGVSFTGGLPTIVGNSIVYAEPGQFSAYDRSTGALNKFHTSNLSGGGSSTPLVDPARNQVYIFESYSGSVTAAVTAYSYNGSNAFTQQWQYTGIGTAPSSDGGLDANGNIYTTDSAGNLVVLRPDGSVLNTITGQGLAAGTAPVLTNKALYTQTASQTKVYDLATLALTATVNDSRGSATTNIYKGLGPVTDQYLIEDHATGSNSPGFSVYSVPEPTGLTLPAIGIVALLRRRRRSGDGWRSRNRNQDGRALRGLPLTTPRRAA